LQSSDLEKNIQQLVDFNKVINQKDNPWQSAIAPLNVQQQMFQEAYADQNGFAMPNLSSFTKVSGSLPVIALGVIMSQTVGGFISRFLPNMSKWASIIAGALIMWFAKSNRLLKDFGAGVLIGGLATVFAGLGSQLGGIFQEPDRMAFEEERMTFGGVDGGTMVTSPDRRTLR